MNANIIQRDLTAIQFACTYSAARVHTEKLISDRRHRTEIYTKTKSERKRKRKASERERERWSIK